MILDWTPTTKIIIFLNIVNSDFFFPYHVNLNYVGCSQFTFISTCEFILFSLLSQIL
jgi:hypothetical protein